MHYTVNASAWVGLLTPRKEMHTEFKGEALGSVKK